MQILRRCLPGNLHCLTSYQHGLIVLLICSPAWTHFPDNGTGPCEMAWDGGRQGEVSALTREGVQQRWVSGPLGEWGPWAEFEALRGHLRP